MVLALSVSQYNTNIKIQTLNERVFELEDEQALFAKFDDSKFVLSASTLEGKTIGDAVDLAREQQRIIQINEDNAGRFWGLDLYSLDAHLISLSTNPISSQLRPPEGWKIEQLRKLEIKTVNIYHLDAIR